MNEQIIRNAGFNDEVDKVNNNRCSFCGNKINFDDFTDKLSEKEFIISGLCQSCQNKIFNYDIDVDYREQEDREI